MENYNAVVKQLRKEQTGVLGRLQAILYDADYVARFAEYPLVANERCGLWYVTPPQLTATAYFKSTDGHTGHWQFLMRRLNLHILPLLAKNGVLVLVDSTRKGKLMPDALSKTVPMWCAVLNYIMFSDYCEHGHENGAAASITLAQKNWLHVPSSVVSPSEHASMQALVPRFATEVQRLGLVLREQLVAALGDAKPIVPLWIYPGGPQKVRTSPEYFLLACLTASAKSTPSDWVYPASYVQGAGDDHELWMPLTLARGKLEPNTWWTTVCTEKRQSLQVISGSRINWEISELEFERRVNEIVGAEIEAPHELNASAIGETGFYLGSMSGSVSYKSVVSEFPDLSTIVVLLTTAKVTEIPGTKAESQSPNSPEVFQYALENSKKGARGLRAALPEIMLHLRSPALILCDTGRDLAAGVLLAAVCKDRDSDWNQSRPTHIDKDVVRRHLAKIGEYRRVDPSRNTLQSVNTYLMGGSWK